MPQRMLLYSKTDCGWCHGKLVIVKSRLGGYVTENCIKDCAKNGGGPRTIEMRELPDLDCQKCGTPMQPVKVHKNYGYRCPTCSSVQELHDLVPWWNELFDEHGFAIPNADYVV
jgi:hypothetical protein